MSNIQNPMKDLWCSVFSINPDIFRTLVYFRILTFRTLSNIYDEVFYLELFVTIAYLDSWYVRNLSMIRTQGIQNTVNLQNTAVLENSQPLHIKALILEPAKYSEIVKHLWQATFYRTLCKSDIFRIRGIFSTLSNIYDGECYSESSQQTFVLMKTSWRRLDEEEYILINHTSSGQDQYICLIHTSSRRLQDVFKTPCQNVFKTSSRHFQDVFKTFSRPLQDVFKTSSKRLQDMSQIRLEDIFKKFWRRIIKVNCFC